jgi:hypothetical protein
LADGAEVRAKIVASEFQERTKDATELRVNATEAWEAGAAKDMSEDGFGLIVGGVCDGNFVELAISDEPFEEGVARAAGGVFEIGAFFS